MLSFLVGSTQDLKTKITPLLEKNQLVDPREQNNIKSLTAQIWGSTKPWYDVFGWISEAREEKIKIALTLARTERKIELLPKLEQHIKNLHEKNKTRKEIEDEIFLCHKYLIFTATESQPFYKNQVDKVIDKLERER